MATKIGIEPEHDLVFVLEDDKVKQTVHNSGIVLTEVTKYGDIRTGKVVAVSDRASNPLTVQLDDKVYFTDKDIDSVRETKLGGKTYIVLRETELMGYERD